MRHVVQNWNSNLIFSQLHLLLLYIYIYIYIDFFMIILIHNLFISLLVLWYNLNVPLDY